MPGRLHKASRSALGAWASQKMDFQAYPPNMLAVPEEHNISRTSLMPEIEDEILIAVTCGEEIPSYVN